MTQQQSEYSSEYSSLPQHMRPAPHTSPEQQPPGQQSPKKKRQKWPYILLVVVLLLGGAIFAGFRFVRNITPEQLVQSNFVKNTITKFIGEDKKELVDLMPEFLGFTEPRTYLVLFLNNTELRPGGGFIGSFAVVRVNQGQTEVLAVEGSENLDGRAIGKWKAEPPKPIANYLAVDQWYFRDSNWSPDFVESSKKALEIYRGEGGVAAQEIDTVIAFTPTALEQLMEVTGPFTIEGIALTPENVTEKLEYEVEYGYADRGIQPKDRKLIIKTFFLELLAHVRDNLFDNLNQYVATFDNLINQKHLLVYSTDPDLQAVVEDQGMAGQMKETEGDYLMWVDANVGALKTDHAMERHLSYTIARRPAAHEAEKDYYIVSAHMEYTNNGSFDWRTTRYRTYARVFVPEGAELISVIGSMKADRSSEEGVVDQGVEQGKQWFGTFVSIEPGETKSLDFIYRLPLGVQQDIENDAYTLLVQKQLGTIDHALTVDLNFGKTITSAIPVESKDQWGDGSYTVDTDLKQDRDFSVMFD